MQARRSFFIEKPVSPALDHTSGAMGALGCPKGVHGNVHGASKRVLGTPTTMHYLTYDLQEGCKYGYKRLN